MKKVLCITPAWKELWVNFVRLIRMPEFKSIIVKERAQLPAGIDRDKILDWTTRLEIGSVALLWCQGSLKDKADFFYDLVNPGDVVREGQLTGVAWSDDELKLVFVKLLQMSTDMPERYKQAFKVVCEESLAGAGPISGDDLLDYDTDLFTMSETIYCVEEELSALE